jgi:HSP20 family molecular chaperone IbpA
LENLCGTLRSDEKYVSLFGQIDLPFEALVRVGFSTRRGASLGGLETWFQAELLHRIALSAVETEEVLKVKAEVPSFSEEKIEVSVEPRCLMIEGKRESKKGRDEEQDGLC